MRSNLEEALLSGAFLFSLLLLGSVVTYPLLAGDCQPSSDIQKAEVAAVIDGDTLRLKDGRHVRLIGLDTPELGHQGSADMAGARGAREGLRQLIKQTKGVIFLQTGNQPKDRYGRLLAHVYSAEQKNLNRRLLEMGLSYQIAVPPNLRHLACYLDAEALARRAGMGLWQGSPRDAQSLREDETGFRLLQGRVTRIGSSRSSLWLNLQGGLALRITWDDWSGFELSDPKALQGRRLEVRGWLYRVKGEPRIRIRHPSAIRWL